MKRKTKKFKNFILKSVTLFSMSLFIFSSLMIGTGSITYKITLVISMVWLALFGLANGWFEIASERWDI